MYISNQYLNLAPVVAAAAIGLSKEAVLVNNEADGRRGISRATWILVGNPQGFTGKPEIEKAGTILAAISPERQWTDDYSSLFKILR